MKPSESSFLLKYILFFLVTAGICFGIGFMMGAFPNQFQKLRGQSAEPLKILFSEESMVPRQLLFDFEKFSGIQVEAKVVSGFYFFQSEINKSDLLFAPLSWYGSLKDLTRPDALFDSFLKRLFPDFLSPKLASNSFLPIFWSIENPKPENSTKIENKNPSPSNIEIPAELTLWGFFIGSEKKELHPKVEELLNYLLTDPAHLASWVQNTQKATTLPTELVGESFRPEKIRHFEVGKLKILDRLESLDH